MTGEPVQTMQEQPVLGDDGSPVLMHAETGEAVQPGHPAWPTRLGIRQLTIIANELVDDRECEHGEIPMALCVNIPLAENKPYGIGEPMRLKALQYAKSDALDGMVQNVRYGAYPAEFMSETMAKTLGEAGRNAMMEPGKRMTLPDEIYERAVALGGPMLFQQPAPMPESIPAVYGILDGAMMQQSGHNEVMQGQPSNPSQSGRAIEALQSAGTSLISAKGRRLANVYKRLTKLSLHQVVWGMDVESLAMIISKYPPYVLEAIHARAREIEWNVKVQVQAGTGALQSQKRSNALADRQAGVLDDESYCEAVGLDYDTIDKRRSAQLKKQAKLQAMLAPPPGQEQQGQDKGGKGAAA